MKLHLIYYCFVRDVLNLDINEDVLHSFCECQETQIPQTFVLHFVQL